MVYRQPIITVLGHVDSGKCVSPLSEILTNKGYVYAYELYEKYRYDHRPVSIYSLNVDKLKLERSYISAAEKILVKRYYRIRFNDGSLAEVTPEHPFLVCINPNNGVFKYIKSLELKPGYKIVGIGYGDDRIPTINGHTVEYEEIGNFGLDLKEVVSIKAIYKDEYFYDFKAGCHHNFIISGIVVHNTTLLDKIRGTGVQLREAGGITQHIGASLFPKETLEAMCGPLLKRYKFQLKVPGLLVIDTPGHEVFTNLRKRGGSAADIAILVVDIIKGFQPQTHESLQILISRKVPFLVAANKVDLIHGWKSQKTLSILESLQHQSMETKTFLEEKIANIIAALSTYKFEADRFDRIRDFRRTVAIVPVSAKTGEGIQELITVLIGLVQRFMLDKLEVDITKPGQGVILEVTSEVGFGTVLRAIHTDGVVKKGDYIVTMSPEGPIVSRIKAILMPAPLDEIRDPRKKFSSIDVSYPAAGIIISASEIENVYAGAPFYAVPPNVDVKPYVDSVVKEISAIRIDTDKIGVIVKADTLGSLEAMVDQCRRKGIPVRKADVGVVSKKDVLDASVVQMKDYIRGVVLAFNVGIHEEAEELAKSKDIKIFTGNILYRIIEEYQAWISKWIEEKRKREFESLILPGKIQVLGGYVFRYSKPAIVGVRVLGGRIKPKYPLITLEGKKVGKIHQIQDRGVAIGEAKKDMEVAISIREAVVGRHFDEGDILIVDIPEDHVKKLLKEFKGDLTLDDMDIINELIEIKRRKNPLWART